MDKVILKKHDRYKVIISETLPYETPIFFSNYGLYRYLKKKTEKIELLEKIIKPRRTRPFNYNISKNDFEKRMVSIPHPASQIEIAGLIFDNADLITYLCSKSELSIRKPTGIASYFFTKKITPNISREKEIRDNDVTPEHQKEDLENDYNDEDNKFGSSFFSYSGYTLLYKFHSSLKFQSLEKKYTHLLKFDVAKCFSSIYTHSISWAIKGKDFSKKHIGKYSFEHVFDTAMQNSNHGETNGIIIGPEFSRVFAEIILQRVDSDAIKRLKSLGLNHSIDYEIKRYVDDYFVFTRDSEVSKTIHETFKDKLSQYKLFVNNAKETNETRPFVSNLSIAKHQVSDALNNFFISIKRDKSSIEKPHEKPLTPSIQYIYKPYTRSNNLINKFKSIVKSNNTSYSAFSGLVMSIFRSRMVNILEELPGILDIQKASSTYKNFIIFSIDFLSFIYIMNTKVRTSFLLAQIMICVSKISQYLTKPDQIEIEKKIRDESKLFLKTAELSKQPRIDFVNTFIAIKHLFGDDAVPNALILDFFKFNECNDEDLDYFDIVSLLYLCCKNNNQAVVRTRLYEIFLRKIMADENPSESSELTLLLLDLATFPCPEKVIYKNALQIFYKKTTGRDATQNEINKIFNQLSKRRFFVDWQGNLNLEKMLQKKEMQRGYDS